MRLFLQSFCVWFLASAIIAPAYAEKLLFYVDVSSVEDVQKKLMPCMQLLENTEKSEALGRAAMAGNYEAAKALIESGGFNINAISASLTNKDYADGGGYTPLQWAIIKGNTQVAELLLQQPDIEPCKRSSVRNSTALHIAARTNNAFITKMLLTHPKMSCINYRRATESNDWLKLAYGHTGATARDVAYDARSDDVLKLLKKHRAKYAFPDSSGKTGGRY